MKQKAKLLKERFTGDPFHVLERVERKKTADGGDYQAEDEEDGEAVSIDQPVRDICFKFKGSPLCMVPAIPVQMVCSSMQLPLSNMYAFVALHAV